MFKYFMLISLFLFSSAFAQMDQELVEKLDNAAVTIKTDSGQGSGSVILKEMRVNEDSDKTVTVAFVLTAAHVVEGNRRVVTSIIDGIDKKTVEFTDPGVLQELYSNGRRIGEVKLDAKVIRYSDAQKGHDIAVLLVYAKDKLNSAVEFETDHNYLPPKGMRVVHIGSSNGQIGSNSFTTGNISQTGRLLGDIGGGSPVVFDQTSAPAEPGSSGCMIVRESDGKYIGMLVRGGSSTFNFIVPIRRIHEWADEVDLGFLFHEVDEMPTLQDVLDGEIEPKNKSFSNIFRANASEIYNYLLYTEEK